MLRDAEDEDEDSHSELSQCDSHRVSHREWYRAVIITTTTSHVECYVQRTLSFAV